MSHHKESAILLDFDKLYLHTNGMDDKYRIFIPNLIELATSYDRDKLLFKEHYTIGECNDFLTHIEHLSTRPFSHYKTSKSSLSDKIAFILEQHYPVY